jgi:ABC-type protease/lipase transport system fused ATPase/permease subunit
LLIDALPNALLSSQAGQNLKNYLASIKGRKTVIMCTYREDYLKMADSIVLLRGVEAPMSGTTEAIFEKISAPAGVSS